MSAEVWFMIWKNGKKATCPKTGHGLDKLWFSFCAKNSESMKFSSQEPSMTWKCSHNTLGEKARFKK
jgi:hypothetical protein